MIIHVVGAGIVGASAAWAAASRGHQVVLHEQFSPANTQGSSHGRSRIVRKAYPEAFYTEIMVDAYPMWGDLQRASGRRLLHECGLLFFGAGDHPLITSQIQALKELSVPHQVLRHDAAASLVEGLWLEKNEVGVLTPEAGWVDAAAAVQATVDLAVAAGAELRIGPWDPSLSKGEATILCTGAWIRDFVDVPVQVTLQTVAYISGRHSGPVWIEETEGHPYGFPSEPGSDTFKMALHRPERPHNPQDPNRQPSESALAEIEEIARRRFPTSQPQVVSSLGCLYTTTANEDFLLGRADERTVFASACSGHGFKFGPWIGRLLVDMVEELREPPERWQPPKA